MKFRPSLLILLTAAVAACAGPATSASPQRSAALPSTGSTTAPSMSASTPASASATARSATASASSSASATISADELKGTVVFARAGRQYGDETLFTVRADGSDDQRIGGFLADKTTCCARWSPDGKDILIPVLAPDGRITTGMIAPDGSNLRTLPLPEGELNVGCGIWSVPAGRMVCEGMDGLYTARIPSGDDLERVLDEHVIPVDVSPDGKQIVYIGPPVGGPTGVDPDAPVGSLFVVNMDGTNARRITPDGIYATSSGRWSPDGEWILFGGLARPGDPLWVVRPDGSDFQEVFKDAEGRGAGCAVWSPDGEFIMFCLAESGPATLSVAPPNGLYVVRADGSDLTPIVTTPDFKRDIDWTYGGD